MILTDGHRTVTGTLKRESRSHVWLTVAGQLHGFRKPKWHPAPTQPARFDFDFEL